jgi:(p)ppGpp synthase/HD superfamily hydrolase
MTFLSKRFDDALVYANTIHASQTRKGTEIPYMSHLMGVASLTLEHGGDEGQAIAALLHDAVEDCGGEGRLKDIRSRFGEDVAQIVEHCTDSWVEPKPAWDERKRKYIKSLAEKPERSLLVSLADKTHNAGAILADLHKVGDKVWDRFTASKSDTIGYYSKLLEAFGARLAATDAAPLLGILSRRVAEIDRLARQD